MRMVVRFAHCACNARHAANRVKAMLPMLTQYRTPTREQTVSRAYVAAEDPVVTTAWLAEHLEEVLVLDVRGHVDTVETQPGVETSTYFADYDNYLEGHIPGAVFFNWTKDAIDEESNVPVQLQVQPDLLAAALEAKGVSSDKPVVVYDAGDGMMAARLWWVLTVAGHPSALVLEGGWARWKAEGRPSELDEPCTLKVYSYFEAQPQPVLRVTLQDIQECWQLAEASSSSSSDAGASQDAVQRLVLLLDTRSEAQYTGKVRRGPRGGHIPGAVCLPRPALLDPDSNWYKPLEQQQQLLQQVGAMFEQQHQAGQDARKTTSISSGTTDQKVILYCNGGVAACTAALALHRLGHRNWAVYDGSWNEYGASDLPVTV